MFANNVYSNPTITTEGNVTTYTFTGEAGNVLYPEGNLNNIKITVTKSDNLKEGDKVRVMIPASLIPLRKFDIDATDGTMSVTDTYPIHLFFNSSLKAEAKSNLANPDEALSDYIDKNSQEGNVSFYANAWTAGESGDTIAHLKPARNNSYYYFKQNTPIYTDEACTLPASEIATGATYYYKHAYYELVDGRAESKEETLAFHGGDLVGLNGATVTIDGHVHFKAGTPRLEYINNLHSAKAPNVTQTGEDVINPQWNDTTSIEKANAINVHLGNNGKLSVELPGTLAISKTVEVAGGYTLSDYADTLFTFEVNLPNHKSAELDAVVKNAAGEIQGTAFKLAVDVNGKATHSIKHGETLYIYGLSEGDTYEVIETNLPAGFTQTDPAGGASGTIAAGATSEAKFVNTYSAAGTLEGSTALAGAKVFTGRDWNATDKFAFLIEAANANPNAPLPENTTLVVENQNGTASGTEIPFNFGNIAYDAPGTYVYQIYESEEESGSNPGVTFSQALYEVAVTVTDGKNGTLTATSSMTQVTNDAGTAVEPAATVGKATFTNTFSATETGWNPSGMKSYTDNSGQKPLERDLFNFRLTPVGSAPMPEGATSLITTADASGSVAFGRITFSSADVGKTYTYAITEVVKNDADEWVDVKDGITPTTVGSAVVYVKDGMTYDPSVWTVEVAVSSETVGDEEVVKVTPTYKRNGETQASATGFSFINEYTPEKVTLAGDAFVHGTKTLTGRDMLDNETFDFTLTPDAATAQAIADGAIVRTGSNYASASEGADGAAVSFDFGDATFAKPGTYTFTVQETGWNKDTVPSQETNGLTFDAHICTVSVTVADDNGVLWAEVAYDNAAEGSSTTEAAFKNVYKASNVEYDSAQLDLNKVLSGRNWTAEDSFTFDVAKVSFNGQETDEAKAAMPAPTTPVEVKKTDGKDGEAVPFDFGTLTFTQAGTYVYQVTEQKATTTENGITYSGNVAEITVTVTDNVAKGKLEAEAAITFGEETFINTYTSNMPDDEKAKTDFKLHKVLEGRAWLDTDEFTFNLVAVDNAPLPKDAQSNNVTQVTVNAANAENFSFGEIEFIYDMVKNEPNRAKTFMYQVAEQAGSIAGITYSENVATITITVRDNGAGKLLAEVAVTEGSSTFTNTYESSLDYAAAGGLRISKVLTGHAMSDEQFSYTVTPADKASADKLGLEEGANEFKSPAAADGETAFVSVTAADGVKFTQADAGKKYVYTVSEKNDGAAGYTYDAAEYTVTIETVDDPATAMLTVTTTVKKGEEIVGTYAYTANGIGQDTATVPFANSYAAEGTLVGSENLIGQKVFNGRAWSATDTFTFKITAAEGVPLPAETQVTVSKADLVDGKAPFNFGNIVYRAPGTYEYQIEEVVPSQNGIPGVRYSQAVYKVVVTAQDNNDGTLNVTSKMVPAKNDSGEVVEGDATVGMATFTNVFSADAASWSPAGVKTYTDNSGAKPLAANMFNFRLTAIDGAPMPEGTTGSHVEASNHNAEGDVSFASIPFTAAMVGNTYTYTIEEIIPAGATAENNYTLNGMTYDPTTWTVTVAVGSETVSGKEVVKLTIAYSKNGEPAEGTNGFEFANSYTPSQVTLAGDAFVHGTKTLTGRNMKQDETFGFTLAAYDDATKAAVADDTVSGFSSEASASGGAKGAPVSFNFGDATFTKPGTYIFAVTENRWNGGELPVDGTSGMTFDRSTWTVTVVVNDDNGQLKVDSVAYAANGASAAAAAFVNRYATGSNTYDTVEVPLKKIIDGREWLDSDSFTFKIEAETADAPMPKDATGDEVTEVEVTKANKDAFSFGTITYTFDDVKNEADNTKTFTYKVTEQDGDIAGMTYDVDKVVYLDITVSDNGNGTLSAVGVVRGGNNTFTNKYDSGLDYTAAGGLRLSKTLTGHAMADGQFTFMVTPADKASADKLGLEEGANEFKSPAAADGETAFIDLLAGKDVKFTQADAGKTYTYTIVEKNDGAAGYTYDAAEYTVTIETVDDPATAKLTVTTKVVGGEGGDKTFTYVTDVPTLEADKAVVPFANSYSATTGEAGADVDATKELTGRPLEEGEFSFGVKYANAAEGEDDVAWAINAADGTVSFGKFNYDTDKLKELVAAQKAVKGTDAQGNTQWTIQYVAYEKTDGLTEAGITPTKAQFTFVVTVTDNNDGTLTATASTEDQQGFTFVNAYNTDGADIVLSGTKVLLADGYAPQSIEGKFTFTITSDDANAPLPQTTVVKNKADGSVVFDAINFTLDDLNKALGTSAGVGTIRSYTFVYKVTEAGTVAGVMNDQETTKTISVKVTDDGKGHLTAALDPEAATAFTFTNTYKPEIASVQIEGTKTLVNRDMNEGETFDFTLAAADDATEKALRDGSIDQANLKFAAFAQGGKDGQPVGFNFGTASFTKPGTYTFTMQETGWTGKTISTLADKEGLTFDDHTCTVKVKVTDDGQGMLSAEVDYTGGAGAAFTNAYLADMPENEKVKTNATFTKKLNGRSWLDTDEFTFKIEALTEGAPLPKDAQGNDVTQVTVNEANAESFSFGQITYTFDMVKGEPDRSKTFQYKVTEVKPAEGAIAGIEYSKNEATLEITVADNGKGQLIATVVKKNDTFENAYSSGLSYTALGGLKLSKTLTGHAMADGQFTFKVTPLDAESAVKLGFVEGENTFASPAAEDGATALIDLLAGKDVQFTQEDAGKKYVYTVSEKNDSAKGYTYDTAVRTVTITTADDPAAAKLTVTTTVVGGPEGMQTFTYMTGDEKPTPAVVPFANGYFASTDEPGGGSAEVEATKELTGRPLEEGEFSFGVKYAASAAGEADVDFAVNDADGKVSFTKFGHYTTETLAALVKDGHAVKGIDSASGKTMWTIQYVAYEKTDGLAEAGISATTPSFGFTVAVFDNNDGTLTATVAAAPDKGYVFKNVYSTGEPVAIDLMGRKVLKLGQDGLTPDSIEGKFTFTIEPQTDGAPLPQDESGQTVTEATNDANGNVDFGSIAFSLDDLNKALDNATGGEATTKSLLKQDANDEEQPGEYVPMAGKPRSYDFAYKVTETGSASGVTNDAEATRTIAFRVTDDGKGHLTVEPLFADGIAFTFTNTYDVEPKDSSITDQLTVAKSLTGRAMNAGEFSFELVENGEVVATAVNDANGNAVFGSVTYTRPGVHNYTIREAKAGTTEAGVTYDGTTFAVRTVVSDNGDGTLSVEHAFVGNVRIAEFKNVYKPSPTSIALGAAKVLTGKTLAEGQFTFMLTGENGSSWKAKNAASGQVLFPTVTFDKVGVYHYTITEVNDGQANITYDSSVHKVTVTVTDNLKGNLVADISYENGSSPMFKNTYTPPAPKKPLSKTGDDLGGVIGGAAVVMAIAAGAAGIAYKRSRKRDE